MKNIPFLAGLLVLSSLAHAGPREDAYKLHNRLAGVPPKADVLEEMTSLITSGNAEAAAAVAMENPNFYKLTLKNWIKPWSNREQTTRAPFNDYVATILGVIKDDLPFDKILYDDIIYTVNVPALPAYANDNNNHYRDAENQNQDLMATLVMRKQSDVTGMPVDAVSGVTTTRNAGENYFQAGTNRRVNRFIFMNYLCKDYEDLHDTTIPDFWVARDVERNPGGDSRTYKNKCVGCHAGQDGIRGAYAYYNYGNNRLNFTRNQVQGKYNQNNYFPQGFVTTNDSWTNMWAQGQNASLGWRGATSGTGAQSLGMMFAKSKAFSSCMARKVYKLVCMKDVVEKEEIARIQVLANSFEANNEYNMKKLIAKTSAGCVINE